METEVPAVFRQRTSSRARLWHRQGLAEDWAAWLETGEARLRGAVDYSAPAGQGRGSAPAVQVAGRRGVWRINRHGGLFGPPQGARYRKPDRLFQEARLSEELREAGVSTPEVLLALAVQHGLFWHQHLVTAWVEDATTVFDAREDPTALTAAESLLEQLFELGLWASDLHPGNLLWQAWDQRCWLIDLAGAKRLGRPLSAAERHRRRERFARYFTKHAGEVPPPFDRDLP